MGSVGAKLLAAVLSRIGILVTGILGTRILLLGIFVIVILLIWILVSIKNVRSNIFLISHTVNVAAEYLLQKFKVTNIVKQAPLNLRYSDRSAYFQY